MLAIAELVFYVGVACFVAAALVTVRHLSGTSAAALGLSLRLASAGAACLAAMLALRWAHFQSIPLTTMTDSLSLFVLFATLVMLWVLRKDNVRALACFYVPPLAALCLMNAATAHQHFSEEPWHLPSAPLVLHVGLVFLSYAMFLLASMTSAAYLFQARHLKRHHLSGLSHRLPSLEELDRTLFGLVGLGYPSFVATLILGVVWAWFGRSLLGEHWWLSPKILSSPLMVALYAVAFHARRSGRLRGTKLAYFVLIGFSLLLLLYVVLTLMGLRSYHFRGTPT